MARAPSLRLILASASPARRDLLSRAHYSFDVMPAGIDEPGDAGFSNPRSYVQHVAWLKASAVAQRVQDSAVVLSADTVGWLDGRAVGKPSDREDARRILGLLSGREHELWTGVCLWRRSDNVQIAWQELTRVAFARMDAAAIEAYLQTRQWEGCSGAYAIQEQGDPYVRVIEGSLTNVIGLPMESLAMHLRFFESAT
jgi:septum formation protein